MRQLRETRQHWRDRKRIAQPQYADIRREHRRTVALLQETGTASGATPLTGGWSHYSCVGLVQGWVLVFTVKQQEVVLVRVAPRAEIFA